MWTERRRYGWLVAAMLLAAVGFSRPAGAIAPSESEMSRAKAWFSKVFLGEPGAEPSKALGVELVRQDHGIFEKGRSSRDTSPLRLGDKSYQHGLGTHSVSEIVVRLDKPAAGFEAEVGIDNNYDTAAKNGSVVFVVEVAGKEAFRSPARRGSDPPLPVRVELSGARELTLRVLDAGDGPSHDQADWADAAVTFDSGPKVFLDDVPWIRPAIGFAEGVPFSFVYGGKPSAELLPQWTKTAKQSKNADGATVAAVTYRDPATGLEVVCEATAPDDLPAVEWLITFENRGKSDTPPIEAILPMDLAVAMPPGQECVLRHSRGSECSPSDFQPLDFRLEPNGSKTVAPVGGRSSNGWFPFFNLICGDQGAVLAIGWSGQWQLRAARDVQGRVRVEAGQQQTRLTLHPGEKIRTPRILLIRWQDDPIRGHNFCRAMVYRHMPALSGAKPLPHVQCNSWFPVGNDGGLANEPNQIELLRAYAPLGIEYLVMDAGWYGTTPVWSANTGTWTPRKDTFPNGLEPVGKVASEVGIRFGMWFEPERVVPGTWLDREHADWLLKVDEKGNRLLNLGLPEVQKWFVEMVSGYIAKVPLGYFRLDFNIDPLPFWRAGDPPDRAGMTEIRYIEGLYAILDELRRRHPDVLFEGCASGGRRIDVESLRRCHTYWRSDLYFNHSANQQMIHGASLYLPGNYINTPLLELAENPYALRSTLGSALCLAWDPRPQTYREHALRCVAPGSFAHQRPAATFDAALAKSTIEGFKRYRHLGSGDFYPLLPHSLDDGQWMAYQFHRDDLGEGMALVFRRGGAYSSAEITLAAIEPEKTYEVAFVDSGETRRMTGRELAKPTSVGIAAGPGSAMIVYKRQ